MSSRNLAILLVGAALAMGCGDSGDPAGSSDSGADDAAADVGEPDGSGDAGDPGSESDAAQPDAIDDAAAPDDGSTMAPGNDTVEDVGPEVVEDPLAVVPRMRQYQQAPTASLLPDTETSCAVIADEVCEDGTRRVCSLWHTGSDAWAQEGDVPPMTEQAFWFDRYYDLYHQANGQSMDIDFTTAVLAGTPESEWSKPEYFRTYDGIGDSSGWTGTALFGAAARYAVTGTEADYQRMLTKVEAMMFMYEVNGIPGMLVRSHWGMLPEGAPEPLGHWGKSVENYRPPDDGHFNFLIGDEYKDRLPAYYYEGVEIEGVHYDTEPRIQADASRDMYVRSMPGVLLAYDLLRAEGDREAAVRGVVQAELPCTLNRLKKGRIVNLQQNAEVLTAVTTYFAGDNLLLDEGDLDFETIDEMTFFVLEQPRPGKEELFDPTCPDGPPMDVDPEYAFDAADDLFLLDFAAMAARETGTGNVPIAWSMHVTVRASDTMFMTQWAMVAWYLTGDDQYLEFLQQLMEETDYWATLNTFGAFQLPRWCAPHFAPSISYPSLYNVLARVDREAYPDWWTRMSTMAFEEGRLKENGKRDDAYFGVLYGRMVDSDIDPDRDAYLAESVAILETYGMNPDDKLEPDRSYPRNFVDNLDPDVELEEIAPGDPEWTVCEEPIVVLGIEVPPPEIDGIPVRSVDPLPLPKRIGGTLLWQMDPWMVKREYGGVGMDTQWPMLGMFTPYWVGRADGVITEGEGLALGWRDTGEVCGD